MSRSFLFVTVFFTGLCVTAIELTASRFLAPFFGASIFIWANVIGVVLAALALGYYLGGRFADKNSSVLGLYTVIFFTGFFTIMIPLIGKPVMTVSFEIFSREQSGVFWGSLIAVLILFAFPLILLGMVSPWAAKLATERLDMVGSTVGKLYSISTIGSIFGVFLPVLVTIPFLGTARTFFLFGILLLVLGAFGLCKKKLFSVPLISAALLFMPISLYGNDPQVLAEKESLYNTLHVRELADKSRYLIINEGQGVQSFFNPTELMSKRYWDAASLLPAFNPEGERFLTVGVAGGTAIRIFHHFYPEVLIDGVDVDADILKLAEKYFNLKQDDHLKLHIADGRMFLKNASYKYDFVLLDAYTKEASIPFHLVTKEFFQELKGNLTEKGVVMINVATFGERQEIAAAITNTLAGVFVHTSTWWFPNSGSWMIVASDNELRPGGNIQDAYLQSLLDDFQKNSREVTYNPAKIVFTDDKTPIEIMARLY